MSAADELDDFYADTVSVETYLGPSSIGARYAAAVPVAVLLVDGNRLVRDGSGTEVTSTAQVTSRPENGSVLAPLSRVTIGTRVSFVITTTVSSAGTLDLPAHCRSALT